MKSDVSNPAGQGNRPQAPGNGARRPLIVGGLIVAAAAAAGLAALLLKDRPADLGESFRYDIANLKKVDPKLMIGRELPPIPAQVREPAALAVDGADRIYVGGEAEIAVLEPSGHLLRKLAVALPVTCLAVDEEGAVYAGHTDRIVVLSPNGEPRAEWAPPGSNSVLTSLAIAGTNVFAADAGRRLVWRFDRDGRLLGSIGARDKTRDFPGFFVPSPYFDLAIAPDGELWVVDPGRHRFIQFQPDGDPVCSWERTGGDIEGFSGCCNPSHIAIRADGSFVTSEKGLVRIKIHTAAGALVGVLAAPDRFAEDTHGIDLAVDSTGRILALNPNKAEILVFATDDE